MTKNKHRPLPNLLALAASILLLSGVAHAEIGVVWDQISQNGPRGPYEVRAIVEDGDPVGQVWVAELPAGGNRFVLNPNGLVNGDGAPSLLFNVFSDLPVAAWARHSAGGYDVVISHFANGAWTTPLVLAEDATVSEPADPFLVVDPADGTVHLLYWTEDPSPRVMHRQAPADLSSWGPASQISAPGDLAVRPSGVFQQGTLHVAYENHAFELGGTPRQIVHAWQDSGGYLSEVVASTDLADWNRPVVHSSSSILWIDWLDSEGDMTWTRKEPAGAWEPISYEPFGNDMDRDYHVRETIERQALD